MRQPIFDLSWQRLRYCGNIGESGSANRLHYHDHGVVFARAWASVSEHAVGGPLR
jgi:hypothetical protein